MNKKEKMNLFALILSIRTFLIGTFFILFLILLNFFILNYDKNKSLFFIIINAVVIIIMFANSLKKDKETLNKLEDIIADNDRSFTICPFDSTPNKKA